MATNVGEMSNSEFTRFAAWIMFSQVGIPAILGAILGYEIGIFDTGTLEPHLGYITVGAALGTLGGAYHLVKNADKF